MVVLKSVASARPSVLRWSLRFARPVKGVLAGLAGLSLLEILLRALTPWALKALIDYVLVGQPVPAAFAALVASLTGGSRVRLLVLVVVGGFLIQLLHQAVLMVHTRLQAGLAQRMVFSMRQLLFTQVQGLSLTHHSRTPTGQAVYHLDSDAAFVEALMFRGVFPVAFSAVTLVVMFGILFRVNAVLALCALSVVPGLFLVLRRHARSVSPEADRVKVLEARVSGQVYETLSGVRLVKGFAREDYELARYAGAVGEAMRARLGLSWREAFFSFFVAAITLAGTALVLGVGGYYVLAGELTVGTLLVVVAYLGFVFGPMTAIANMAAMVQHALASARRVRATLELQPEAPEAAGGVEPPRFQGEVRFESVTFAYGGGRPVLQDVSFTARPGEMLALVGPSGSGKTTLASLVNRFYEPTDGTVFIDGTDVRRYRLGALRRHVAVVLQEAVLMSGTIADNIRYGRLDATDEEVRAAAVAARADDFIRRLPMGYDTMMEAAGAGLSGGERQRLSVARAFLKDAPVLIMDEPTSALDVLSEELIFDALRQLRQGRTTFVIAHRLSTVRDADRILVLDEGRLVGEGTHDALERDNALYREVCQQLALRPAPFVERRRGGRRTSDG